MMVSREKSCTDVCCCWVTWCRQIGLRKIQGSKDGSLVPMDCLALHHHTSASSAFVSCNGHLCVCHSPFVCCQIKCPSRSEVLRHSGCTVHHNGSSSNSRVYSVHQSAFMHNYIALTIRKPSLYNSPYCSSTCVMSKYNPPLPI